ncbi:hypothetical protein CspeluHIS016_0210450 [Cutaneotrichosporon spelunceum]|uniref:Clavaminate synthase-like protein n=1 Tax=Cutaneotrichosporon spelunceum TaxID=1672016 RepID=A0AAD3YBN9_9TREE|nr:hypothetical protein CspeluHIS016_0210450 [Cutaneotrichosporon spelunceum]
MPPYTHLTPAEAAHFLDHGWLRIPNAIAPEYLSWLDTLWVRLGMDGQDKTTWTEEYVKLPRHREVRAEDFCPTAWGKICELVGGEDRIDPMRERWYGDQFIVNFGRDDLVGTRHEPDELRGWHTDNDWYRQFLDSSGNALTLIFCFTDIPAGGGGTCLNEDGIKPLCELFYNTPEGLDPPFDNIYAHCTRGKVYTEVTASAGDLLVTHGMLPHSHSPNHLHYARVITNPHVNLAEPFDLNRSDGDYSLCEQVILRALNRTSIPEYTPTRPRLSFYPRTAYFKREKIRAELARLLADASVRGQPGAVDSVYLRGEAAIAEHERRNGYDKAWGPTGVATGLQDDVHVPSAQRHVVV